MTQKNSPLGDPFVGNTQSRYRTIPACLCCMNCNNNSLLHAIRILGTHTRQAGSDDDDAAMAASQVIEAVSTVLQSTKAVPELFPAMESHLLPMLAQVRTYVCHRRVGGRSLFTTVYVDGRKEICCAQMFVFLLLCCCTPLCLVEGVEMQATHDSTLDNTLPALRSCFVHGRFYRKMEI